MDTNLNINSNFLVFLFILGAKPPWVILTENHYVLKKFFNVGERIKDPFPPFWREIGG